MTTTVHLVNVEPIQGTHGLHVRALCRCGWDGPIHANTSTAQAWRDAEGHEAAIAADPLERIRQDEAERTARYRRTARINRGV